MSAHILAIEYETNACFTGNSERTFFGLQLLQLESTSDRLENEELTTSIHTVSAVIPLKCSQNLIQYTSYTFYV